MDNLEDFFSSIGEEKKKEKKKAQEIVGEVHLEDLFDTLRAEKKKEKEKTKEIVGEVSLGDLFNTLSEEKKKIQEHDKRKKAELEKLEREAKVFESFLFSEPIKKEVQALTVKTVESIEEKKEPEYIGELEKRIKKLKTHTYSSIDRLMKSISKKYKITTQVLHDDFKNKHNEIPDEWVKQFIQNEEPEEKVREEVDPNIRGALDVLDKLKRTDDDIDNEEDTELRRLKREVEQLRKMVYETIQTAAAQGGGGEVNLRYLDDIDRSSISEGKILSYDAATKKFKFISPGAASSLWNEQGANIYRNSNVGINSADPQVALDIVGDTNVTGIITASKLHVDSVGSGVTFTEDLVVQGDARVTGILSIGTSSIVLDSNTKVIRGVDEFRIGTINPISIKKKNTGGIQFIDSNGIESNVGIGTTDSINTTGIITASSFSGDGSGLTGIVASGSGVVVRNDGSNVGTAVTIDFGSQLDASFSGGVATINLAISLSDITNVNTSNLSGISTDYLMVYDPSIPGFKFVNPKTYFGINNDSNPSPDIVDYGTY